VIRDRRLGLATLAIGAIAIVMAQRIAPLLSPPLYDGVIVVEPYRWVVAPPGQAGDPTSAAGTAKVKGGESPIIAIATTEEPPQAQIFAVPGALVLRAGTTSISMSITPLAPDIQPADGHIVGNVYRISVTDQAGTPLTAPASEKVSVVLRGPEEEPFVTVEQRTFESWKPLKTEDAGFGSTYLAVVTSFGDFALVAPGPSGSASSGVPEASAAASSAASSQPSAAATGVSNSSSPLVSVISSTSPGPSAGRGPEGGPPIALIAGAIALVILGVIGLTGLRRRDRRRERDRRARPRRR
jgi:hypothetical protein